MSFFGRQWSMLKTFFGENLNVPKIEKSFDMMHGRSSQQCNF